MKFTSILLAFCVVLFGCQSAKENYTLSGLDLDNFKTKIDGKDVALYILKNSQGLEVCVTNYGGRIVSMMVPDKNHKMQDVVLGHESIEDYVSIDDNFGALIGPYGNRINKGSFSIDSTEYSLPKNNFGHCLHGGPKGFHHVVWSVKQHNDTTITLSYLSPDGDAGFPGNVNVQVKYTLTKENALEISYQATSDKPTILNLTNHSYFNLSGDPSKSVLDETVWFNAGSFTPIDSTFMTTGEIRSVTDTPFDFTIPKTVGRDIESQDIQLENGRGYDHNMVLATNNNINMPAAYVYDPTSGIKMEVFTDEPGIQFYTGNFLDGTVKGKKGIAYPRRSAICLETQHFPDSPNKPEWPSVVVRPGETYKSNCIYKFSAITNE